MCPFFTTHLPEGYVESLETQLIDRCCTKVAKGMIFSHREMEQNEVEEMVKHDVLFCYSFLFLFSKLKISVSVFFSFEVPLLSFFGDPFQIISINNSGCLRLKKVKLGTGTPQKSDRKRCVTVSLATPTYRPSPFTGFQVSFLQR